MNKQIIKTGSEHFKIPAFWRSLGCELESIEKIPAFSLFCKLKNIENQDKFEIVKVRDLLCEDLFCVFINSDTVNDVYQILKLRRKELIS